MFDHDSTYKVMDLIETADEITPFTNFRDAVIKRLSESENTRLQKVLVPLDFGDQKPSALLAPVHRSPRRR